MKDERIPIRTEMVILEADPPSSRHIGLVVQECSGSPIRICEFTNDVVTEIDESVEYAIPTMFGFVHGRLRPCDGEDYKAEIGDHTHFVRWCQHRLCWVSWGSVYNNSKIKRWTVDRSD